VQIVVLVDESGSLSPEDLDRERDAVRLIVQGEPSVESTVSVFGFGSANATGVSPVDAVCPATRLNTTQDRQFLADCVNGLRSRTPAEGTDTDHVAALRQALNTLSATDPDQPKIVYLLTDGVLDVGNSPEYGSDPAARNVAARQKLPGLLDELNRAGVQVWPLGFGDVDRAQLDGFATGAAQDTCGEGTPRPSAKVIAGSADLLTAIGEASSAARCTSVGTPVPGVLAPGQTLDLPVDIPAIASEGSILVFKRDPTVTVSYLNPEGTAVPTIGELGGSRFDLTGQGSETEALRVVNPLPGTWTVRLTSAPDAPTLDVNVLAIFQGAIRSQISVDPPCPAKGTDAQVTMLVNGSRAAITDPAQLEGLRFQVGLSGAGFDPVSPVSLIDSDGDGMFQGDIRVPDTATGSLTFTGSVSGIGVSPDERHYDTRSDCPPMQAVLTFDEPSAEAEVGSTLAGTVRVTNATGTSRSLRLDVVDQSPGAMLTVDPSQQFQAPPTDAETVVPFTVRFDPATALGPTRARLRLVDDSGATVEDQLFDRTVVPVPSLFQQLWWLWATLVVVLVAVAAAAVLGRDRARGHAKVKGVQVSLLRDGRQVSGPVGQEFDSNATVYEFGIEGEGKGAVLVTDPAGVRHRVTRNGRGPLVDGRRPDGRGRITVDGVELFVRDRVEAPAPSRRPPRGGSPPEPPPSYQPGSSASRRTDPKD